MSVFPFAIDSDNEIIRIDDNLTELGGLAINQLRDAVFAIEENIGTGAAGSMTTLADRINVSLNSNGTLRTSALTAVGLVTLPIVDNQVASNAGIKEYKLALDHTTSDLYTIIVANKALLDAVNSFLSVTSTDFLSHLSGATFLSDGTTLARHVASHIDINAVSSDSRDPSFVWTGLLDKTGTLRTATNVAGALLQINDDLTSHENATEDAHLASAITVNTDEFTEIPVTANTVQKVIDYLNDAEELNIGQHRAVQHAAGIPSIARSSVLLLDGYNDAVVPSTPATTYLVHPPAISPVDNNTSGDDVIRFVPEDPTSTYVFDSQFSQVKVGDIIRVNYGNGLEGRFPIDSIRYTPGSEWVVRINGSNLCDGYDGYASARIDRPAYDTNTSGVLAVAAANSIPNTLYPDIIGSVIVGHPRGAVAFGLGFDGNELDSDHYKLYLELYPSGVPSEKIISLPAIDVTGDLGTTPGSYTIGRVVQNINDGFRKVGYNYRFIAFEKDGSIGIALADALDNASFAIISGTNGSGTLSEGIYTENVVDDVSAVGADALGLGKLKAAVASPAYQSSFIDSTAAQLPTKVFSPHRQRNYIVDGHRRDDFAATYMANADGYWPAVITGRVSTGSSIETTYRVELDLSAAELRPGKTLVAQPMVEFDSVSYFDNDYGRFIIKSVVFTEPCGSSGATTDITVINGVHAIGNPIGFSSGAGLNVKLFFSEDSVSFNDFNLIDSGPTAVDYHRLHEIYVTKEGKTFSHERARLPYQNESGTLLRTDYFHISDVSAKLRGYRDSNVIQNRYIRFYCLSYDTDSGEYDGYIGQRIPSTDNVTATGPITTGKKNVVTRFYDETYNDYIDLVFSELNSGPTGIPVLSDGVSGGGGTARYVDIEVFPTLKTDDELLLLATVEVNWNAAVGKNIIENVKNQRQFGSIDEKDFTPSAIDFINAGDRLLHQNGVFRGYEFISVSSTDNRRLTFSGGSALVNGAIVTSNNSDVLIPQISAEGITPATVTWGVCVNEFGYLVPIILTDTADQFFAQAAQYYVESVTFDELIINRRDLTLLYVVTASIASITITDDDVQDARKFLDQESQNHPLTLVSDNLKGNFTSFDAVSVWIKNFSEGNSIVRVRGNFTINSSVDLTGFERPVIFEGDNATITFPETVAKGFLVGSNVKFHNINFVYGPRLVYTPNDRINTGNGCLYLSGSVEDVSVTDCNFVSHSVLTQRPPFINVEMVKGDVCDRINIVGNTFTDDVTISQAVVAIINLNTGTSIESAALTNSLIEKNICNSRQGIYLTSVASYSAGSFGSVITTFDSPGLKVSGTSVAHNTVETIGFVTSGVYNTAVDDGYIASPTLSVVHNTSLFIGVADSLGHTWDGFASANLVLNHGTGNVLIQGNSAAWIFGVCENNVSDKSYSSLVISNNILQAFSATYLSDELNSLTNTAIVVSGNATEKGSVSVTNNTANSRNVNGTAMDYQTGMWIISPATVSGNIIRGLGTVATLTGIILEPKAGAFSEYLITGNRIYRSGMDMGLGAYIKNNGSTSSSESVAIISGNFFDSPYIDSGNTDTGTISSAPISWIVERNINQTVTFYATQFVGHWGSGQTGVMSAVFGDTTISTAAATVTTGVLVASFAAGLNSPKVNLPSVVYDTSSAGGAARNINWTMHAADFIPSGAYVTNVAIEMKASVNVFDTSSWTLRLMNSVSTETDAGVTIDLTGDTLEVTSTDRTYTVGNSNPVVISLDGAIQAASNDITFYVRSCAIEYRW